MPSQKFLIGGPFQSGLEKDKKPFLIADDAFEQLNNAYVFRGRVRKRFGSYLLDTTAPAATAQLNSRLRIELTGGAGVGITDGAGAAAGTVPGSIFKAGQLFSIGTEIYTVPSAGAPVALLSTGAGTGTYNTTTGAYTFAGAPATTQIYFYPAEPVMGFANYEAFDINNEPTLAFDTQFAYIYLTDNWERLGGGDATWTGSNSQFFWSSNWRGSSDKDTLLFTTNFNENDSIRYFDFTDWTSIRPVLNKDFRLKTARIIIPFKDRLLFFNTVEANEGSQIGTSNAVNGDFSIAPVPPAVPAMVPPYKVGQAFIIGTNLFTVTSALAGAQPLGVTSTKISPAATGTFDTGTGNLVILGNNENKNQPVYFLPDNDGLLGTPFQNRVRFSQNGSPIQSNAYRDDISGKGDFLDCPTREAIVSAEFLRDRLIVFFERSTWELAYTGNEVLPFRWQQLNTELGAESSFSIVPFDKVVLGVGNTGIHACNGVNVDRIDDKIPDEVFDVHNDNEGVFRVHGIRDYFTELVYWTFPDPDTAPSSDPTFPTRVLVFNYKTGSWALNNDSITAFGYFQNIIDAEEQSRFRHIICGNQQGFTFIAYSEESRNAPALQISNIALGTPHTITAYSHNLNTGDYVYFENVSGTTGVNGTIVDVIVLTADTFTATIAGVANAYTGGGTLARVTPIDIISKQFNFFAPEDRNAAIEKVNFLVDRTTAGELTVGYFPSFTALDIAAEGLTTGSIDGTNTLETTAYPSITLEAQQTQLWHQIYMQAEGETIQVHLFLLPEQIIVPTIAHSDFVLHAMLFSAMPTRYVLE